MTGNNDRRRIKEAADRLLKGKPIRSSGALNIKTLAEEAGLHRSRLTHVHTDLKDDFYAQVRSHGHVPESEVRLRDRVRELEEQVGSLRESKAGLEAEVAILRRINNLLASEKAQLEASGTSERPSNVSPLRRV